MNLKAVIFLFLCFISLSTNFVYGVCQAKAHLKQSFWAAPKIQMRCDDGGLANGAIISDKIVHAKCNCKNNGGYCEAKATPGWFWRTICECPNGSLNKYYSKNGDCVCEC
uniref:Uncharacterized protein n=1 Tax=Panagrolaimus sp. ES5 TaxID=591445 RepID=A0AC34F7V9_9BILA